MRIAAGSRKLVRGTAGLVAVVTVIAGGARRSEAQAQAYSPLVQQPVVAAAPADSFAPGLGISYQLYPYGNAFGARLTQYPNVGSPLEQIQLEPGDMIYAINGRGIRGPQDLNAPPGQVAIDFVNIRTNEPQRNFVYVSGNNNGGGFPPNPGPVNYILGINMTPVPLGSVAAAPAAGANPYVALRPNYGLQVTGVTPGSAAAVAGLEVGDTIVNANGIATGTIQEFRSAIANSNGSLRMTVRNVRDGNYVTVDAYPTPVNPPNVYAAPATPTVEPQPFPQP